LPLCNLDKCGDKGAPVATFVANVFITLDNADLDRRKITSMTVHLFSTYNEPFSVFSGSSN